MLSIEIVCCSRPTCLDEGKTRFRVTEACSRNPGGGIERARNCGPQRIWGTWVSGVVPCLVCLKAENREMGKYSWIVAGWRCIG